MKKIYLLLLVFTFSFLQGQNSDIIRPAGFPQAQLKNLEKQKLPQNKVYGDTLYYEDFDSTGTGGFPAGWTQSSLHGMDWIWSNSAPGGQYSTTAGPLQSTTGTNGFLSLPLDFYNTPFPVGGPKATDSYISSPAISITPTASVLLRLEHAFRYCCSITNEYLVEVSNNGVNWTTYDLKQGRSPSSPPPNPESLEFNVTSVLGNQSTAYIRFRVTGASFYYFMIDDLHLVEGFNNAFRIDEYTINFGDTFNIRPIYTQIPASCDYDISTDVRVYNHGVNPLPNVRSISRLYHDSTLAGSPGAGIRATTFATGRASLAPGQYDSIKNPMPYYQFLTGHHRLQTTVETDSLNDDPAGAMVEFPLIISDSVFARDLGNFIGGAGPDNYVGGGNDGDRWGLLYNVKNNDPNQQVSQITAYTISIFVANDSQNIGAVIRPKIWEFDETQPTIAQAISLPPVGDSPFNTQITAAMLGTWIHLPFFPEVLLSNGNQYLVGWEQISGASTGNNFLAGRDRFAEPLSPPVSNFLYNAAGSSWGWVTQIAGVRLNVNPSCRLVTSIKKNYSSNAFAVSPNPNTGQFRIQAEQVYSATYQLKIRNTLGQVVLEKQIPAQQLDHYQIDLGSQEKGIYFLTLENGKERWVEKLVLQ